MGLREDERNTTMNKAIQKMMMALAVCCALCGTAMAYPPNTVRTERPIGSEGIVERSEYRAPKGNPPSRGQAPTAMKAPAQKTHATKAPAPAKQAAKIHSTHSKHNPRHEVVRHTPAPPPAKHHEPKHHHNGTLHTEDWCEIGASLIGGLVGGLIGASI